MEKLIRGIHQFQNVVYRSKEDLFRKLTRGQHPLALFITCSDSRIVPDLICQTEPGDLFIMRNAGNLVPSYTPGVASGEAATIEYAIRGLGIKDIILCGHTGCGAMRAAMDPDSLKDMPRVRQWLGHADVSAEIVATQYSHLPFDSRCKVLTQENVLVQIENLRTHPAVAAALAKGELRLHPWMYKMETGQVFSYDTELGQFTQLVGQDGSSNSIPFVSNGAHRSHTVPVVAI